jgi:hypothetical protein
MTVLDHIPLPPLSPEDIRAAKWCLVGWCAMLVVPAVLFEMLRQHERKHHQTGSTLDR